MLRALKKNNANDDEGLGRSRGGLSSKIHCVVDGLGNPVDFILTGGEVHDNVCADAPFFPILKKWNNLKLRLTR